VEREDCRPCPGRSAGLLARGILSSAADPASRRAASGARRGRDPGPGATAAVRLTSSPALGHHAAMAWARGGYAGHADRLMAAYGSDLERYRAMLDQHVRPGDRILHVGCGWDRSGIARRYLPRGEVVGVDLDARAGERYPGRFWRADVSRLPFAASTFDVACAEYVLEHVADPGSCFAEVSRVLRPGGVFVVLTPNRWSYKALAAAATPHWIHRLAAAHLRPDARAADDVFPTLYRANTARAIRRLAAAHGLLVDSVDLLNNGPTWFRRAPGLLEIGHAYHRVIGGVGWLAGLRCAILARLRRTGQGSRRGPLALRCRSCGADAIIPEPGGGAACPGCGATLSARDAPSGPGT
jgi:SAM-dependent methyltransferase